MSNLETTETTDTLTEPLVEPTRQRRKEARPGELTAAAIELFVEKGFAATRLDDIAARAGVSKGTLYLYFDSKEALFKAVVLEGIVPVFDAADAIMASFTGSNAELMQQLLTMWWRLIGSTPLGGLPKLVISEARNFPEVAIFYHDAVIARARSLLKRVLQRGIDAGEFRPLALDMAADVLFAPILLLAIRRHSVDILGSTTTDPELYLETHFELALRGLINSEQASNK